MISRLLKWWSSACDGEAEVVPARRTAPPVTLWRVAPFSRSGPYYCIEYNEGNSRGWVYLTRAREEISPEFKPDRHHTVLDKDVEKLKAMALEFKEDPAKLVAYNAEQDRLYEEMLGRHREWWRKQSERKTYDV